MTLRSRKFAYLYWSIAAGFYFYQYVLRVSGGLLTDTLMQDFNITASAVGTVMSVASFSYVFMQIPAGATADYFGVRILLPLACLVCAVGAYLFSVAESMPLLLLARGLIGVGAAYAFVSTTKIIAKHFSESQLSLMVSLTILAGSFGGMVGTGPLASLIQGVGWRISLSYIALVGAVISILAFYLGKGQKRASQKEEKEGEKLLNGLKFGLKTPQVLLICAWGFCIYMPICVFADTWGVPYLISSIGCTKGDAAEQMSLIYLGLMVGCPIYGWLGSRFSAYNVIFALSTFLLSILLYLVLWQVVWIRPALGFLMFFIGFFISVQLLMFPAAIRHVPARFTASIVGLVNTATMMSGALFQKLVGVGVDYLWDGTYQNEIPLYNSMCYRIPLSVLLISTMVCFLISLFIYDKKVK